MNILHVGKYYDPVPGGIESVTKFIVDSLQDVHNQKVVVYNTSSETLIEEKDRLSIVRVGTFTTFKSQPLSWHYRNKLKQIISSFNPDIVYFHYPNPVGAIELLSVLPKKVKLIVHWHSDIVEQKKLYPFVKGFEKQLLQRADKIVGTSPLYVSHSLPLASFTDKIVIIPCAIDTARFDLNDEEAQQVADLKKHYNDLSIVFFIGRHVEYKGIRYLLEAEKHVKTPCVFVIAGDGPQTEYLKSQYKSSRLVWLGRLSEEELKLYYHAATAFAFPSITRNEAFGVVLAESMYCNCPSATFTIEKSGVNWVSPNGISSVESPNRDAYAFAQALDNILSDEKLQQKLSINGRDRVISLFSKDVVKGQYRELIASLF